jgi:hypothetical protein
VLMVGVTVGGARGQVPAGHQVRTRYYVRLPGRCAGSRHARSACVAGGAPCDVVLKATVRCGGSVSSHPSDDFALFQRCLRNIELAVLQ